MHYWIFYPSILIDHAPNPTGHIIGLPVQMIILDMLPG